jgi:uncharacterized membrane protein YgaE (UPF0421/DUF939 family)
MGNIIFVNFVLFSTTLQSSRNTENENKRCKIFNKVLNMSWDYVRGKKTQKEKINKQTKRKHKQKKNNKKKLKKKLYDSLVPLTFFVQ